jgi:hypothetical protein
MLSKNVYLALNVKENGKLYAFAWKVSGNQDLLSVLRGFKNLETVNVCPSFKSAKELVAFWNDCYKANGSYMFSATF